LIDCHGIERINKIEDHNFAVVHLYHLLHDCRGLRKNQR
jgi:hypothetical protein